jgi:hypothetical protein
MINIGKDRESTDFKICPNCGLLISKDESGLYFCNKCLKEVINIE